MEHLSPALANEVLYETNAPYVACATATATYNTRALLPLPLPPRDNSLTPLSLFQVLPAGVVPAGVPQDVRRQAGLGDGAAPIWPRGVRRHAQDLGLQQAGPRYAQGENHPQGRRVGDRVHPRQPGPHRPRAGALPELRRAGVSAAQQGGRGAGCRRRRDRHKADEAGRCVGGAGGLLPRLAPVHPLLPPPLQCCG